MSHSSLRVSIAVAFLLTVGAARSAADTITFNNSSLHPDGVLTIGNTVSLSFGVIDAVARIAPLAGFNVSGSCGPTGQVIYGCLTLTTGTFVGPVTTTAAN